MKQLKLKQYMFTFEGGGWNTVWAKTLKGAIKAAEKEEIEVQCGLLVTW